MNQNPMNPERLDPLPEQPAAADPNASAINSTIATPAPQPAAANADANAPTPTTAPAPATDSPAGTSAANGTTAANGYTAQWNAANPTPAPNRFASAQPQGMPYPGAGASAPNQTPYAGQPAAPAHQVVFGAPQGYQPGYGQNPNFGANGSYPPPGAFYGAPTPAPTPKKKKKEPKYASRASVAVSIVLAVVLSLGCGLGGVFLGMSLSGKSGNISLLPPTSENVTINHYNSDYSAEINTDGTVASVVSKVSPCVVEIYTDTVTYSQYYGQQIQSGAGSGVIISENGYIITCAHVIDGADKVTVRLKDGKEYDAAIVGSDSQTDIAVIKIDAGSALPFVGFGSSDNLVVGQPVIAVGNPLGSLGGTVTTGIISATNREIEIEGQLYNLLQTNAAINSGNSGGGLFDMNGNLIGVVNAKSGGTSIEGLGFAIPSNQAEDIAAQLMAYGFVKGRPTIGIRLLNVNSQEVIMNYIQYSRFFTDYGVYIMESEHDSLELGDRIVAMDGTEINAMSDIQKILSGKKVGDTLEITVARLNGRRSEIINVSVTLRERTAED